MGDEREKEAVDVAEVRRGDVDDGVAKGEFGERSDDVAEGVVEDDGEAVLRVRVGFSIGDEFEDEMVVTIGDGVDSAVAVSESAAASIVQLSNSVSAHFGSMRESDLMRFFETPRRQRMFVGNALFDVDVVERRAVILVQDLVWRRVVLLRFEQVLDRSFEHQSRGALVVPVARNGREHLSCRHDNCFQCKTYFF